MDTSHIILMIVLANIIFCVLALFIKFILNYTVLKIIFSNICKNADEAFYKRSFYKVYRFGIFADLIGFFSLLLYKVATNIFYYADPDFLQELIIQFFTAIMHTGGELDIIFTVCEIIISAIFIFVFDYFMFLKKTDFTKKQRILSALAFAIFTAPYYFFIPMQCVLSL